MQLGPPSAAEISVGDPPSAARLIRPPDAAKRKTKGLSQTDARRVVRVNLAVALRLRRDLELALPRHFSSVDLGLTSHFTNPSPVPTAHNRLEHSQITDSGSTT